MKKFNDIVAAMVAVTFAFAVAYGFVSMRLQACPLFTTCVQVR